MSQDKIKKQQSTKEREAWYKSHGICTKCGQNDAAPNRVRCFSCLDKQREYDRTHKRTQSNKEFYNTHKKLGLCVSCNNKATHGIYCYEHMLDSRRRSAISRKPKTKKKTWIENGLCYACGSERYENHKVCKKCYDRLVIMGKKGRESQGVKDLWGFYYK